MLQLWAIQAKNSKSNLNSHNRIIHLNSTYTPYILLLQHCNFPKSKCIQLTFDSCAPVSDSSHLKYMELWELYGCITVVLGPHGVDALKNCLFEIWFESKTNCSYHSKTGVTFWTTLMLLRLWWRAVPWGTSSHTGLGLLVTFHRHDTPEHSFWSQNKRG